VNQSLYNAKTILPEKGYVESGGKYFPNLLVVPNTENIIDETVLVSFCHCGSGMFILDPNFPSQI
jgi:hypothetical protein